VIIAPGEKIFGALLAIAGAAIILTGHWATTDVPELLKRS
jgi:hypothetical protein